MNISPLRATYAAMLALAMLALALPAAAQETAAAPPQQAAVPSEPSVPAAPSAAVPATPSAAVLPAAPAAVPSTPSAAVSAQVPAGSEATPAAAEGGSRPLKSATTGLHELSPWSMFLSADILVKAVMIGLAFASLMTWTVFIAKMIELSLVRRRLRKALGKIGEANSLADAQLALGAKDSVLSSLLAAALREARLSAGISSDAGIKERAASSFAEIVRAEARRIHLGMGVLATVGATSPFIGLFGTVWGIMNSFIGISKSQTTNLAVVAPGIAEALLATAFGLAAAIPAVIIYNHFARRTKGYLELVARASGAAGRLLSRDLDRTHVAAHSRAAE
jgi:biopolymer transport protein ExbB